MIVAILGGERGGRVGTQWLGRQVSFKKQIFAVSPQRGGSSFSTSEGSVTFVQTSEGRKHTVRLGGEMNSGSPEIVA